MPKAKKKGFALLTKEARMEMARKGGKAAQKSGNANSFNSETGRKAAIRRKKLNKAKKMAVKNVVKKKVAKKRK